MPEGCAVCGSRRFGYTDVLWPALIDAWQLSAEEAQYINVQQGFHCLNCSNNLRSMALAAALCRLSGTAGPLDDWIVSHAARNLKLLEINEAGTLTKHFRKLPQHTLVTYPDVDIHALPFAADSFDVVVHSDTLEHVAHPVHALGECRRVLQPGGLLAYTIPIIVRRMTRSREGLSPSFHGDPSERSDYLVRTEFGADAWTCVLEAGFRAVTMHAEIFPAGLVLSTRK